MLRRNTYYALKPFIPARVRLAFRRMLARRARGLHKATWPVDPACAAQPEGWPGWPEGKAFAFVLTHDVEGPSGVARCRELAELEMSLGFRSSFNFIPEGGYSVSDHLRHWLTGHGFEVGVHDLHHDGKLYRSREEFRRKAARINGHLARWGAVGYRSGFMHHNLEWQHDLEVLYDASTFDSDPFEPQPDGAGTIFPFFVPRDEERKDQRSETRDQKSGIRGQESGVRSQASGLTSDHCPLTSVPPKAAGYVELPYTLVQDSTLFLLLQETTPRIWDEKLDWIAAHGGMALLNVHPDYMRFGIGRERGARFPLSVYRDFLHGVRARHGETFWQPLPRTLATWYRDTVAVAETREQTPSPPPPTMTAAPVTPRNLEGR